MIPSSFDEANLVLDRPAGDGFKDCDPLNVLRCQDPVGRPMVISCWKLTQEELEEIQRTGRVWLSIWGPTMPPANVSGIKPV